MNDDDDIKLLRRARRAARKYFNAHWDGRAHPSHTAAEALEHVNEKFDLGMCWVEGWAHDMYSGVDYLNAGDVYIPTLCAVSGRHSVRFHVAPLERFATRREEKSEENF